MSTSILSSIGENILDKNLGVSGILVLSPGKIVVQIISPKFENNRLARFEHEKNFFSDHVAELDQIMRILNELFIGYSKADWMRVDFSINDYNKKSEVIKRLIRL